MILDYQTTVMYKKSHHQSKFDSFFLLGGPFGITGGHAKTVAVITNTKNNDIYISIY
jgi:hypothetical protein